MPLPSLVSLTSDDGQRLLKETVNNKWPWQQYLLASFGTQIGRSACGVRSGSMMLSAMALARSGSRLWPPNLALDDEVDSSKILGCLEHQLPITEREMIDFLVRQSWDKEERFMLEESKGMTIDELGTVLTMYNCSVDIKHASEITVDKFRQDAIRALSSDSSGVIIKYHMKTLGQGFFYGHVSPLAAYHVTEDRFLLLDVWPESTVCWAKTDDLFRSMEETDHSGKSLGYAVVY